MRTSPWTCRLLRGAGVIAALCLAAHAQAADPPSGKKPKTITIELDKLPPDVAKRVLELTQSPPAKGPKKGKSADKPVPADPAVKAIPLAKAIAIAEKLVKGEAVRAHRKGPPHDPHIDVDILSEDGTRTKVRLNAAGELMGSPEKKEKKEKKEKVKDESGQAGKNEQKESSKSGK